MREKWQDIGRRRGKKLRKGRKEVKEGSHQFSTVERKQGKKDNGKIRWKKQGIDELIDKRM